MPAQRGIELWSSAAWLAEAVAWIDERLADQGRERTGDAEQVRVRAWSTIVRAPTAGGPVWFKAAADATAFEVPLYAVLVDAEPDWVLTPLAADVDRAWLLLPDGGPTLGDRADGVVRAEGLAAALAAYGRLQRALTPRVDDLLAAGVPDMRPARMPERFDQALAAVASDGLAPAAADAVERLRAMAPAVNEWADRLSRSPLGASLDHNDLHPWNVLGDPEHPRLYDWGDSVVAHPLASALVPLSMIRDGLDQAEFEAARDGYLEAFAELASPAELLEELELACRLAKIARSLTWDRALRSALDQGAAIEPRFEDAALQTLAALLAHDWLTLS